MLPPGGTQFVSSLSVPGCRTLDRSVNWLEIFSIQSFKLWNVDFGFGICCGREFDFAAERTADRMRGYDAKYLYRVARHKCQKKVCSVAVSMPAAPLNVGHFERVADISLPSQRLITQQ